jgi:ElaB/YqjD/DUF883 family membrane-anchored ribosome-binding protein
MSIRSFSIPSETLKEKAAGVLDRLKAVSRERLVVGANKIREYSRSAAEDSDEWAEAHLYLFAAAGLGLGLIGGVLLALP